MKLLFYFPKILIKLFFNFLEILIFNKKNKYRIIISICNFQININKCNQSHLEYKYNLKIYFLLCLFKIKNYLNFFFLIKFKK